MFLFLSLILSSSLCPLSPFSFSIFTWFYKYLILNNDFFHYCRRSNHLFVHTNVLIFSYFWHEHPFFRVSSGGHFRGSDPSSRDLSLNHQVWSQFLKSLSLSVQLCLSRLGYRNLHFILHLFVFLIKPFITNNCISGG